jgi:hypothetical protein
MAQQWSAEEQRLYDACRGAVSEGTPPEPGQGAQLLALVRAVHDRAHSRDSDLLSKAGELTGALRLVGQDALYEPAQLSERVNLLLHILSLSPQRPLLEDAALVLLSLELRHGWAQDEAYKERVALAVEASRVKTLAVYALSAHLGLAAAQKVAQGFAVASLDGRRARIGELTGLLVTYGEEPGIEALVATTFEALFKGLGASEKYLLVDRLFREMRERSRRRQVRWELLLDPLLSQNIADAQLQHRVLELLDVLEPRHAEVYVLLHLRHAAPGQLEPAALRFLSEHGTRAALPLLSAFLQKIPEEFFLFDRHAGLRRTVKAAQDAIIERAGVHVGALTLAEGEGGGLTLAASFGELSLATSAAPSGALVSATPPRSWWRRLLGWFAGLWGSVR